MSAIDRAFIKAYRDEQSQDSQGTPALSRGSSAASDPAASLSSAAIAPAVSAQPPRRSTSRNRRSAAAAAIHSEDAGTDSTSESARPAAHSAVSGVPSTAPMSTSVGAKPKMVVGRRALQKLAESAVVPAPHLPLGKSGRATEPSGQAQAALRQGASLAVVTSEEAIVAGPVAGDDRKSAPALTDVPIKSQYRLDPASSPPNPRQFREAATLRQTLSHPKAAISASTIEPLSSEQKRLASRTMVVQNTSLVALEVDRVELPPACRLLLDRAGAELEAAANALSEHVKDGSQIIAITSIDEGEGCTTVALCLAQRIASQGARVCLVDGSFAHPQLAGTVGLEPDCGWESVLSGETSLSDVLIESLEDRLTLLPLCKPLRAEEIERARLRHTVTMGALRDQFDIVLIDAGCANTPSGRSSILDGGSIDAAILVGTAKGQSSAWECARRAIEHRSVPCLGVIENRCQ